MHQTKGFSVSYQSKHGSTQSKHFFPYSGSQQDCLHQMMEPLTVDVTGTLHPKQRVLRNLLIVPQVLSFIWMPRRQLL